MLRPPSERGTMWCTSTKWMWVQPVWAQAPKPEPTANQLPTGGKWIANPDGSAGGAITTTTNKMQLDQFRDRGILEFNCFCSGRDTWINLTAPSTSSSTLIRTQDTNLWGRFTANDNVFISSKDGFYASRTASMFAFEW